MKSLKTIQKTFHVFQTLSKIAMILSFVWAGLSALLLVIGVIAYFHSSDFVIYDFFSEQDITMEISEIMFTGIGRSLISLILALTDGILFVFARNYFKTEHADGTPFTRRGADLVLRLGILTIVLPLVAAILSAIICEIFSLQQDTVNDWDNLNSLGMGIVLILTSLIYRYGAELETPKQEENAPTE